MPKEALRSRRLVKIFRTASCNLKNKYLCFTFFFLPERKTPASLEKGYERRRRGTEENAGGVKG
jgi:hypothetical protein